MIDITNQFRERSKGEYYNDFSFLKEGSTFPNREMLDRNAIYRARFKQLTGEDIRGLNYIYTIAGEEFEIPIQPIGENFFKLTTNKILDLIFNNEWTYRTGNLKTDKQLNKLIERTGAKANLRICIGNCTTYGDTGIKVHKNGISEILPVYTFKVVDSTDYNKILGYGLYDVIKEVEPLTGAEQITHIRFEIHKEGWIFDIVYKCQSSYPYVKLGQSVDYLFKYGDTERVIPKGGKWYKTNIEDCTLLSIASINKNCDGAYGESLYVDIQDNVYGLQQRVTIANSVLNNLTQPLLIVGSSMTEIDQETGGYKLKTTNGKYLVFNDMQSATPPQSFQQDYKLDNSEKMVDMFLDFIYLMSEMGKPFMCGEYGGGNLSTESINNLIKPAIDKANRVLTEVYYQIRDAIYCLARLNNININKDDITILFNIGRTDDDTKIADLVSKLIPNKQLVSAKYVLEKYFGLDEDQANQMFKQIEEENNICTNSTEPNNKQLNENGINNNNYVETKIENKDKELEEDNTNEME